jgi:hypothetical protein
MLRKSCTTDYSTVLSNDIFYSSIHHKVDQAAFRFQAVRIYHKKSISSCSASEIKKNRFINTTKWTSSVKINLIVHQYVKIDLITENTIAKT